MGWKRYAIYWLPGGSLGRVGADWLGWDVRAGRDASGAAPDTERPRKYGFHATIKPPFRLADGMDEAGVTAASRGLAAGLAPAELGALAVTRLGRFLALTPDRNPASLAGIVVAGLDRFRAPAPPEELARRRANGLSDTQEALLAAWGYPYVLEEFRMHLTLTGPDPADATEARARDAFAPLTGPHVLDTLSLVGEAADGRFHLIADLPLGGDHGTRSARAASADPTA
ncbi:MAG: DUF1045 domain-containing protein [Pseudomonadota bacterium]